MQVGDISDGSTENIHKVPETPYRPAWGRFPAQPNTGATTEILHALKQGTHMPKGAVVIDQERCKGCGLCIAFCPEDVLAYSADYNQSGYNVVYMERPECCIGCAFCAQTCPDIAIEVYREKKPQQRK